MFISHRNSYSDCDEYTESTNDFSHPHDSSRLCIVTAVLIHPIAEVTHSVFAFRGVAYISSVSQLFLGPIKIYNNTIPGQSIS